MKLTTALALLALSTPAMADVVLTRKVHTDESQGAQGTNPAKDETQTVWLAKDKLRMESGPMTFLVRLDKRKLYLLHPADHTYNVIDLPVNLANYIPKEQAQIFESMKSRMNIAAVVTPTEETERIHNWAAKKYKVQVNSVGYTSEETVWTTKDIEVDWATFWDAQAAVRSLQPGTEAMSQEMRKLEGVTVKAERTRTTAMGKTHVVEELTSAERKEAPEGNYEIPTGFTEVPFDAMSELRKMGGARPSNPGPGDAPPPKREKKEGDKPAPGGSGGSGGGDGSGEKRGGGEKRGC